MTFTYSTSSLTTDLAQVRLEISDTVSATALFADEEIDVFLADEGSVLAAAARACEVLAARYAGAYNFKTDDQSFDRGALSKAYAEQARRLRAQSGGVATIAPTRIDGYSDDIANDDISTSASSGRVRAGYTSPDIPA